MFRSPPWSSVLLGAVLAALSPMQAADDLPNPAAQPATASALSEAKWSIIAECQMVVLPQKAALPLIPDLSDDAKIEAAWAKLQQMIEHDGAEVAANLVIHGLSGQRMVVESIQEVRYATEYVPPQLPDKVPPGKDAANVLKNWPHVGAVPTAFETRNVGTTLSLEPKVSDDGQWIALNVEPQHVRFLKFAKIDAGVLASGEHISVEQPYFSVVKDTLAMNLRAGQRVLLGVHQIPEEDNKMEFFFLKIRTERVANSK
jgi:hypothetical protein